ncbi:MAG TPA: PEP-CTERM sorting domain-containing protein [Cyanobacteria bacterium UBA8803]|nr:PEP-CTERM sorting domain-containing protein [Cyanobacteria bacterium UBA9273]HBL61204.1 PEP-CTERM sorting domain-containing protein [Cyanobacteria bacterium UBA8803]
MKKLIPILKAASAGVILSFVAIKGAGAATLNANFTELPGIAGGSPAGTGVFVANLSNLGFDISSIQISYNSSGLGGSPGEFTGFDLDAIKFSTTLLDQAEDINNLPGLDVFDFSSTGTLFTPGTQRPPIDPRLFGTTGGNINHTVASLGSFDANSSTDSSAFGFVSLGDNGKVHFNLKSIISTAGSLYLYVGEVGNNGEVAAAAISVSSQSIDDTTSVPEPGTVAGIVLLGLGFLFKKKVIGNW